MNKIVLKPYGPTQRQRDFHHKVWSKHWSPEAYAAYRMQEKIRKMLELNAKLKARVA